jgi:hypothetical protein
MPCVRAAYASRAHLAMEPTWYTHDNHDLRRAQTCHHKTPHHLHHLLGGRPDPPMPHDTGLHSKQSET